MNNDTIKCISLWQPYATLVVAGEKKFETRSWSTKYRGRLLIHAAKKPMGSDAIRILTASMVKSCVFPLGAIVGEVTLKRIWYMGQCDLHNLVDDGGNQLMDFPNTCEQAFGDYTPGRYAWELENPVTFDPPIPCRGMQQLFNVPAEHIPELEASHGHV